MRVSVDVSLGVFVGESELGVSCSTVLATLPTLIFDFTVSVGQESQHGISESSTWVLQATTQMLAELSLLEFRVFVCHHLLVARIQFLVVVGLRSLFS